MKGWAEKGKEINRYKLPVIKRHGDVMYSTGNNCVVAGGY